LLAEKVEVLVAPEVVKMIHVAARVAQKLGALAGEEVVCPQQLVAERKKLRLHYHHLQQ
jgi:hypothetical protein